MTGLFRPEALLHRQSGERAGVVLPAPPPPAAMVWSLLAAVVAALSFVALQTYARKEHVTGYLALPTGVARVLAPRPGLVTALLVHDGELVRAGTPLLAVRTGGLDGHGAEIDAGVLAALHTQRDRIADQAGWERRRAEEERAGLADHAASLAVELEGLRTAWRLQRQRGVLTLDQVMSAGRLLATGSLSRIEFQRRQDAALAAQQAEADLARAIAAKQAEIVQDGHAAVTGPQGAAGRLAALAAQEAEIGTRIAEAEGSRATLLTAPVAGRVTTLQVRVGQVADPAVPLLAIVPEGEALRAELLVPAGAIGQIRPGQRVRMAYDAFPAMRFGLHDGTVETVSRTLLRPAEIAGPVVPAGPCYRVGVALAPGGDLAEDRLALAPDMTLSADIVVDRHSLLGWLLAPLRDGRT